MVSIKVDMDTSVFSKFFEIVDSIRPEYDAKISTMLLDYARDGSRADTGPNYTIRTGNLYNATKTRGSLENEIELYVDQVQADYADYIINGGDGWAGDDFLTETMTAKHADVRTIIEDMYNEAIKIWNRR